MPDCDFKSADFSSRDEDGTDLNRARQRTSNPDNPQGREESGSCEPLTLRNDSNCIA